MGCKDIFAELDNVFYKAQSEARLFSCYSGMSLDLCGCVIINLIARAEDLPAVLSCLVWYFSELCCRHQRVSMPRSSQKTCCQLTLPIYYIYIKEQNWYPWSKVFVKYVMPERQQIQDSNISIICSESSDDWIKIQCNQMSLNEFFWFWWLYACVIIIVII